MSTLRNSHPFYNFGNKLRQARWEHGWSQAALAESIGTGTRTIQRWEGGLSLPRPYNIALLLQLFEKTPDELGLSPEMLDGSYEHSDFVGNLKALPRAEIRATGTETRYSQEETERRLAQLERRVLELEQLIQAQQTILSLDQPGTHQEETPRLEVVPSLSDSSTMRLEAVSTEEQAAS